MEKKKIALVIFLIALILLSIFFVIFASRQQSKKSDLQTGVLSQPETQQQIDNQVADNPAKTGPAAQVQFSDEQINKKIEEMRVQINTESKGRALTDDELYFVSFPKEAAIEELKKSK